jgi:large subunit ribosomal protein L15
MKLHELKPDPGSRRPRRRVGRGISAGQGKTAGRGTKGQGARTGGVKAQFFEGGQLPLVRRLPFKRGFNNIFRIEYQEVSIKKLADTFKSGAEVKLQDLKDHRLIDDAEKPVVILGDGDLSTKLIVTAHRFSKSAQQKIEAAGGRINKLELPLKGALATVKLLPKDKRPKQS